MKLIGVAVIGTDEDVAETFVRHNLHYLDHLYLAVDDPQDSTLAVLRDLASEGLPLTLAATVPGTEPAAEILRRAAAEGPGLYLSLTPDDLLLSLGDVSRDGLRRALTEATAGDGDAAFEMLRLTVMPMPADRAAYGADPLRLFRTMESPGEVRRLGGPAARRRLFRLTGGAAVESSASLVPAGEVPVALAYLPVRSVPQITARALGAFAAHLGRGGGTADFRAPEAEVLARLKSGELTNADLPALAAAFAPSLGAGAPELLQGDLAPFFHHRRTLDARLSGPLGAVAGRMAAAVKAARSLAAPADTESDERTRLEAELRIAPAEADMERYFDLIERTGAADVPADLIALAGQMSRPARMPVGMLGDGRVLLPYLEMDISYACNLRCDGCSHYSNYALSGVVRLPDARAWLETWIKRLHPVRFRMLGGEPAINPDAAHIIRAAAEILPHTQRSMVSNGLLLHKRDDILDALAATGTALDLSLHDREPETRAELNRIRDKAMGMGIGCTIIEAQPDEFTHLYRGEGKDILPYADERPFSAWACCEEKNCACIHEGLLWKCPPLAFLGKLNDKIGLRPEWKRYLAHKGLSADAPAERLFAYLAYPEKNCDMCPARRE